MGKKATMSVMCVLGFLVAGVCSAWAAPEGPPSEELVQRLIAEEAEVVPRTINVAVILTGKAKMGDDFETDHAVRVVFLWDRIEQGRKVRRVEERCFYWNEKYGWFFFMPTYPRGGEAVDICSEHLGMIQLR